MFQHSRTLVRTTLVISALAVSLAACSGSETSTSPASPASPGSDTNSSASPASSSSAQPAASSASVSIPGVDSIKEVKFKPVNSQNGPSGSFDAINNSAASTHLVSTVTPIKAAGWAVLNAESKPADMVILTYGDNNSLVAVAPVTSPRPDVSEALKKPAYGNSGWNATFNSSTLPAGRVTLKAWAYNSATKEATQLARTHELVVNK